MEAVGLSVFVLGMPVSVVLVLGAQVHVAADDFGSSSVIFNEYAPDVTPMSMTAHNGTLNMSFNVMANDYLVRIDPLARAS